MSDDIAFKIQLGLILPKLKEKVSKEMSEIIEELANIVKAGSLKDNNVPMDQVKEIIMKDLEIFLDDSILPGKTGTFVHSVHINSGNTYLQAMHVVPERSDTPQKLKTLF